MKRKILLFFAIIVLVSIAVQVLPAQSEEWLSIENEYFVIKYKEGHISDAELILEYCQYARNVTMEAYPHQLDVKVTVYLYDIASWTRSPYDASADPTNAIMYFLTPSDVPEYAKVWVDNLWYQKNIVHEYVHIPTMKDLRTTTYYNTGFPSWLTEGIAEYISVFRTTNGILQKYGHYATSMQKTVIDGSVFFEDDDIYLWGAYIMKYVYETYGVENASLLFKTDAEYFWSAISQSLGVSPQQFEINWIKWIYGEFNVAVPPEYLENEELLEEYQKLSTAYDKLLADYNSLQASYSALQSDYDSLQADYNSLQTNYNTLKSDYYSLNATHDGVASDYEGLQTTYDSLKSDYDKLRTDYDTLKSDCESATKELEIEKSELATNTNLMYVFIITTLVFIATTAYLAIRKRKVKST